MSLIPVGQDFHEVSIGEESVGGQGQQDQMNTVEALEEGLGISNWEA